MYVYSRELIVEWRDCDPAGVVFYPRYLELFDTSTNFLLEAATQMSKAALIRHYGIRSMPIVEVRAKFHAPSTYGDRVRIESTVLEFRRSTFDIGHRLMRGDTLAVEGSETRAWVITHPEDPQRLKAQPIPEDFSRRFA